MSVSTSEVNVITGLTALQPGVFLDRDGVVTEMVAEGERALRPPWSPSELQFCSGAEEAIDRLTSAGYVVVLVTNQPDVGRGMLSSVEARLINGLVLERLKGVSRLEVCYHTGKEGCRCRKPEPGMLITAAGALGISLSDSWMVGDRWVDLLAGKRAGCRTALVETPHSWEPTSSGCAPSDLSPILVGQDLAEVVRLILDFDPAFELGLHPRI